MKIKWVSFFFVSAVVLVPLVWMTAQFLPLNGRGSNVVGAIVIGIWVLVALVLQYYFFVDEPRSRKNRTDKRD